MACARTGRLARTATALALAAAVASACVPNPISPVEHALVTVSGGVYPDRAVAAYVRDIGSGLAEAAGEPRGSWQFLVLDTPETNAFTLPGNRIYVTRGMLGLANDEAELAAVLAHEIGHAVSGDVDEPLAEGDRREAEFRADWLGIHYLETAGYDARAQADILRTLLRNERLSVQLAGGDWATAAAGGPDHPALADRLRIAEREAAGSPKGRRDREAYLAAIDGLVWGNGRTQGFVREGTFVHPTLGFAFDPPPGFTLANRPDAVIATGPRGAVFLLDSLRDPGGTPSDYLTRHWVPEIGEDIDADAIASLGTRRLNGLPAAEAHVVLRGEHSQRVADLTVVRLDGRLYRLTGLYRAGDTAGEAALAAAAESFRELRRSEARLAEPQHLRVHRVAPGEDAAQLSRAMPVAAPRITFELLNGLRPGRPLRAGDAVKLVSP